MKSQLCEFLKQDFDFLIFRISSKKFKFVLFKNLFIYNDLKAVEPCLTMNNVNG